MLTSSILGITKVSKVTLINSNETNEYLFYQSFPDDVLKDQQEKTHMSTKSNTQNSLVLSPF